MPASDMFGFFSSEIAKKKKNHQMEGNVSLKNTCRSGQLTSELHQ